MTQRAEQTMGMFGVMTLAAMMGAGLALLFAPRKGSETREQLLDKMRQAKQASQERAEAVKSKAQEGVDKLKHRTEDTLEEAEDMAAEARSQVEDLVEEPRPRGRRTSMTP